ncbi:polysaccharide deacetylase family protein [Corticimicrobacter populi]|uniref:NodB homology domain-containing protein n=1 Tax=Corticimicrobacter populi TaxID=2175229 RepID=A0A2V1K1U3_9BURK|nr:polysaccharide deacetylase family protein [Corticimicrobacter populi]PWF23113.1 hypothetical protein DD235_08960 [Corticimicrobacter populi]
MKTAKAIPVLMYHHISPATNGLATSPANFASQMRWLARHGWQTLSCAQLQSFLQEGVSVPAKSVLLTFDDGYLDNWQYAHPVLKEHGFSAAMFLVTGWVGHGPVRPSATYEQIMTNQLDGFESWCHAGCKQWVEKGKMDRVIVRQSEVDAMRHAGTFEFHSHTHTHVRWDQVSEDAAVKRNALHQDLEASRVFFDQNLGGATSQLCWPQGYFDRDYLEIAEDLGFDTLYTTDSRGLNREACGSRHIYRIAVRNRGGWKFGQRVMLAASPLLSGLYNRLKS